MLFFAAAAMLVAGEQIVSVPTLVPAQSASLAPEVGSDSAEEIAKDAARDLKDTRFYNKPGATRAQYDAAWQECRLIARGTRTPSGSYAYVYNPAVISPVAAGVGAGIGAALGKAIIEGQLRRANRRNCLLIKGWRLVDVDAADKARLATMTDADRNGYFNTILGAAELPGKTITVWHNDMAAPRLARGDQQ